MARTRFDSSRARGAGPGNLFASRPAEPISVSALTRMIKRAVEDHLPRRVLVAGEVSNLKVHSSGHVYLSLKDAGAQIPAVIWKSNAAKVRFKLNDGLAVIAGGCVEVYEPQGKYQLMIETLIPEGLGALELAFRQLKEKLAKEGLFDISAKKPLPRFPWTVALVTSPSGAAVQDMIRTLSRRFPALRILLYPVAVQGEGSAQQMAQALADLDKQSEALGGIDLIILGRGGGSLEDLWAFNEEVLVRAIFACRIPIISAVGHETDVTISDMVADVRVATPTAGAELAVPVLSEVLDGMLISRRRLGRFVSQVLENARGRLEQVRAAGMFRQPMGMVRVRGQQVDQISERLGKIMVQRIGKLVKRMGQLEVRLSRRTPGAVLSGAEHRLRRVTGRLRLDIQARLRLAERGIYQQYLELAGRSPRHLVRLRRAGLQATAGRLSRSLGVALKVHTRWIEAIEGKLKAVGPERVLARGYSVTTQVESGKVVADAGQLKVGQEIMTRLHKGKLRSRVSRAEN